MKRSLSLILAVIMIIGMMPLQALAEATSNTEIKVESVEPAAEDKDALEIGEEVQPEAVGEEEPNVTLVGQWTNESSKKVDTPKHYELNDKIGMPIVNDGLLNKLAKQFLGWSDKAPVDNGVLAEGAKLFSPQDTIETVFPNGIPADAKIYGVYYEINNPYGDPFPQDLLSKAAVGKVLENLSGRVNNNKISINKNVKPEDVLSKTKNHKAGDVIIDYYEKKDDKNDINEVVLKSEFEMDWVVAMLAYRNEIGSNQLRPILSRNYFNRFKGNKYSEEEIELKKPEDEDKIDSFPLADGEKAGYTHVDLTMDFGEDEGLVIPDHLFLEFKSYSWRPLCVFGIKDNEKKSEENILEVLDLDEESKGKKPDAFKGLVSGEKPVTKFGVVTKYTDAEGNEKNYRKIIIRVILRPNKDTSNYGLNGERIPEDKIPKGPEGTVASEILSNMTLRVMGSADEIKNENIVRVSDKKAKELADGEGKENIKINGSIKGHVFASAGILRVSFFGTNIEFPLMSNLPIKKLGAEKGVKISYVHKQEEPKPEPQPEPKPEPQPEYNPWWPVYFGSTKKAEEVKEKEIHKAYIFGYTDKTVRGNGNLTRAEAAAMVTRLANLDLSDKSKADYNDLQEGAWYLPNINAALKAGMIDATDKNLRPDDKITRGEFAKMLAAIDKDNDYVSSFSDIKGHKYEKEISKIDGNKRIEGYQDGTFKPDGFLTRAEAASFLNRMFNRVADDVAIEDLVNSIIPFKDLSKNDWFYFEIVEATNTHELYRRGGSDKFERAFEKWLSVLN